MAKWSGIIGFVSNEQVETKPGIWEDSIIERSYKGDLNRRSHGWTSASDRVNDDITIDNEISVIADLFARQNTHLMKYVKHIKRHMLYRKLLRNKQRNCNKKFCRRFTLYFLLIRI